MFSFFGGRKKSPEREESVDEPPPSEQVASSNDFVLIDGSQDVPGYRNPDLYPTLPYPVAPPTFKQPERTGSSFSGTAVQSQNCLSGVPFKLSSKAEYDVDAFLSADVSEIIYQIRHLNLSDYEYDFEVEKSVLKEVGQENF